jgi:ankyrin repeat protein
MPILMFYVLLQGMALLHWACDRGLAEMVECLLDKNANIDIKVSNVMFIINLTATI